jgi:hypothetical protein
VRCVRCGSGHQSASVLVCSSGWHRLEKRRVVELMPRFAPRHGIDHRYCYRVFVAH